MKASEKRSSLHSLSRYSLQMGHISTHSSKVSLPMMLPPVTTTPTHVYEEAGSETVEFLRSLDVLAEKSAKVLQNVRFACLQNWFGRAAWHIKLDFISELLRASEGVKFLEQLLTFICTAASKDVNYLLSSQSGGTSNNRVLLDNNRDMDIETMNDLRILDKMWYMSLDEGDQLQVLLGLLLLGGGILTFKVFMETFYLLETRIYRNKVLAMEFEEEKEEKNEDKEEKKTERSQISVIAEESPPKKTKKGKEKKKNKPEKGKKEKEKKKGKEAKEEKNISSTYLDDSPNVGSGESTAYGEYFEDHVEEEMLKDAYQLSIELELNKKLEAEIAIWNQKLDAIRNAIKTEVVAEIQPEKIEKKKPKKNKKEKPEKNANKKSKKKGKKEKEPVKELTAEIDFLQVMPPSVSKAIFCFLDPESRAAVRKVNEFCATTMDSVEKDEICREKLNTNIAHLGMIEYPSHLVEPAIPRSEQNVLQQSDLAPAKTIYKPSSDRLRRDKTLVSSHQVRIMESTDTYPSLNSMTAQSVSLKLTKHESPRNIQNLHKIKSFLDPAILSRARCYERMYRRKHCVVRIVKEIRLMMNANRSLKEYSLNCDNNYTILAVANNYGTCEAFFSIFLHMRVMACGFGKRLMAVTNERHGVIFYSLITGAKVSAELEGQSGSITCMQFHPEGCHIFTGSTDKIARCWHIWSGRVIMTYRGHENKINAISTSQDLVATGGEDQIVKVFHIWSGLCYATFKGNDPVTALCLDVKSSRVFVGFRNGLICDYSYETQYLEMSIMGHDLEVTDLCLIPPLLLSSSYDGQAKIWEVDKSQLLHLLSLEHKRAIQNLNVVSTQVLCGCHGGCVWVWSLLSGKLIYKLEVGTDTQPLYDVYCADEKDHVKIVVSGEPGVNIYEFHPTSKLKCKKPSSSDPCDTKNKIVDFFQPIGSKKSNTKHLRTALNRTSICNDLGMPERVTQKSQRLEALEMRGTVDPSLHYCKYGPSTKKCFVSNLCRMEHKIFNPETVNLIPFPRLSVLPEKYILPRKVPHEEWTKPERTSTDYIRPKRQIPTRKNLLQQYNLHEVSF